MSVRPSPLPAAPLLPPSARGGRLGPRALALVVLLGITCAGLFAVDALAGGAPPPAPAWTGDTVDVAATLPIQEGGRIMPLHTYAGFTLLRLNHRRGARDVDGRSLEPLEVLLDLLVRPERATKYPVFLVETSEIIDAVGLPHDAKKKRDRYSYDDLAPAREKIGELGSQYHSIPAKDRTPVEAGLVELAEDLQVFERLGTFLIFAREPSRETFASLAAQPGLKPLFGDAKSVRFTDVLAKAADLRVLANGADPATAKAAKDLLGSLQEIGSSADALSLIPPTGSREAEGAWLTPADVVARAVQGLPVEPRHMAILLQLERLSDASDDPTTFSRELRSLEDRVSTLASARGENDKIALEVSLAKLDPFYRALYGYLLAFVLVGVTWVWGNRWVVRGAFAVTIASLALHVTGIVMRCVLRSRPPITTLYETTLFVAAFSVAGALVVEYLNPRRLAFALAPILGAVGLFVANKYETIKGEDTMPQLVAVLDTNFWLSTHVTCVTIGYGASLLAGAIAHVRVLGPVLGLKRGDRDFYRHVSKMVYGVLCFGLLFSTVGTILGGIWANESWGRFWGWDPKENGALLIVLVQLAILHARLGGYLNALGVSMAAIACGGVVAFSWWGVNLLGIGLHSYGFTGGLWTGLIAFWSFEALVLLVGGLGAWLGARRAGAGVTA